MIQDTRQIQIKASRERIFFFIETMPNKFPIYRSMESKPFLFLRLLLVDGPRSAMEAVRIDKPMDTLILKQGDKLGPFTLTEVEKPGRYMFTLESLFFNCRTGYSIKSHGENSSIVEFDLISENPCRMEKIYWFFIQPIHALFAGKSLKVIKKAIEKSS